MIRALFFAAVLAFIALGPAAHAYEPSERLADHAIEMRARAIGSELRCLVCQDESIEQSDAGLAHDLRMLIRHRLLLGDTNRQVIDYIVARYGIFVLLDPPFRPVTYLLWLGPPGVLAATGAVLAMRLRRRRRLGGVSEAGLSAAEQARAAELLGEHL